MLANLDKRKSSLLEAANTVQMIWYISRNVIFNPPKRTSWRLHGTFIYTIESHGKVLKASNLL